MQMWYHPVLLWDWVMLTQTASDMMRKEITCGVPQRSVLGSLLWNIAFYGILKEDVDVPSGAISCYTKDTLVLMTEDNIIELEQEVDVWWGIWRCTHVKLAPLTLHSLAWDRHYGPASGLEQEVDTTQEAMTLCIESAGQNLATLEDGSSAVHMLLPVQPLLLPP